MTKNMGNLDRALRAAAGAALLAWAALSDHDLHWLGLIGIVPLMTALVGFCPLYRFLGINSCRVDTKAR